MAKNVWGLSASDTSGAKKYYEANRNKYWWEKSAEVLIFTSHNKELIETIHEVIGKGPEQWNAIAQQYEYQLQIDSGRYKIMQLPSNPGSVTAKQSTEITQLDELYSFAYVIEVYNEKTPHTYEQAVGLVLNDYLQVMEEKWINKLKKKNSVKDYEKIFPNFIILKCQF